MLIDNYLPLKLVGDGCPASEQVAMQRLMDQYRKEQEGLEQDLSLEKERQLSDLRVSGCMFVYKVMNNRSSLTERKQM